MTASNWITKYKYQLIIAVLIILLLIVFFQSLKKDHSLDMVKQELKLKEESRKLIEQERKGWEQVVKTMDVQITTLQIRDSLIAANNIVIDNRLNSLPKKYNETANKITNYGSADLLEYFNNLSTPNDY